MKFKRIFSIILTTILIFGVCTFADAAPKASIIQFLLSQVRTSTTALVGGKVYFYLPTTTDMTGVHIWLNKDATIAASNPYTLDANGTAQLYAQGSYRIIIKDSAGVTRFDRDNLYFNNLDDYSYQNANIYASLDDAVTAIGATPTTLLINSALPMILSQTIPSTLTLKMDRAGIITIPITKNLIINGYADLGAGSGFAGPGTLTINGPFNAGSYQVFSGFVTGSVTFGAGSVAEVYPEWWGITGTADEIAINKALAAFYKVKLLTKTYTLAATISGIRTGSILEGSSKTGTILAPNAETFTAITVSGLVTDWSMENFTINYGVATGNLHATNPAAKGISLLKSGGETPYMFSIRNIRVLYPYNGFYNDDLAFMYELSNVYIYKPGGYGIYLPLAVLGTTITMNNVWVNGGHGGFHVANVDGLVMNNCGSDNIDKGESPNVILACRSTLNYFAVEACTLGDYKSLLNISGGSTVINAFKASINFYDEGAGTESYGIRVTDGAKATIHNPRNWGETHSGLGTAFAIVATGAGHAFVIGHDTSAPTGGSSYGIYTGNNKTTVYDQQAFSFAGYISSYKTIASPGGGELTLGTGDAFSITGTNTITSIAVADTIVGRRITLVFSGILTFTDGGNLKLAGNFVTSADDTISLVCDGASWYEISRSIN